MSPFYRRGLLLCAWLMAVTGCRSPDELSEIVNAQVFVLGVSEGQWVELEIDGQLVGNESNPNASLIQFSLALEAGIHTGKVTVFVLERADYPDDDNDKEDHNQWKRPEEYELEAKHCGEFEIEISDEGSAAAVASIAIVVDDLPFCGDDRNESPRDDDEREPRSTGGRPESGAEGPEGESEADADPTEPASDEDDDDDDAESDARDEDMSRS